MKKIIQTTVLILYAVFAYSQGNDTIVKDSSFYINSAFQPEEYLKYKVSYGLIPGGSAEMRIGLEAIGDKMYYSVIAHAQTDGVVRSFARVSDKYESFIDVTTGLPIRAIRDINENNYKRFNELIFHRHRDVVSSLRSGEHKVPPGTHDILSAFYFARRHIFKNKMKKDDQINITTFFDEKLYTAKIKYKKTEKVNTKFGKISCLKFVPVMEKDSPFKKEKDLQVWFSDDGNFIPVKIRLKAGISKVKCDLVKYQGLKNAFGKPYERN